MPEPQRRLRTVKNSLAILHPSAVFTSCRTFQPTLPSSPRRVTKSSEAWAS